MLMAYSKNPHLPRVRRDAADLVRRGWGVRKVARYVGVSPGTITKWVKKVKRCGRVAIPTLSSRQSCRELTTPLHSPRVSELGNIAFYFIPLNLTELSQHFFAAELGLIPIVLIKVIMRGAVRAYFQTYARRHVPLERHECSPRVKIFDGTDNAANIIQSDLMVDNLPGKKHVLKGIRRLVLAKDIPGRHAETRESSHRFVSFDTAAVIV